jgi:hypothetical protein
MKVGFVIFNKETIDFAKDMLGGGISL